MLLRCESLEPPMSQLGQNRKGSERAYVVRFCLKSRHRCCVPARPVRAITGREQMQQTKVRECSYSITSSARARKDSGIVRPTAFAALALTTSSNLVA
jgi:hypothetical protein